MPVSEQTDDGRDKFLFLSQDWDGDLSEDQTSEATDDEPQDVIPAGLGAPTQSILVPKLMTRSDAVAAAGDLVEKICKPGVDQASLVPRFRAWMSSEAFLVLPNTLKAKFYCFAEAYCPEFYDKIHPIDFTETYAIPYMDEYVPQPVVDEASDQLEEDWEKLRLNIFQNPHDFPKKFELCEKTREDINAKFNKAVGQLKLRIKKHEEFFDGISATLGLNQSVAKTMDEGRKAIQDRQKSTTPAKKRPRENEEAKQIFRLLMSPQFSQGTKNELTLRLARTFFPDEDWTQDPDDITQSSDSDVDGRREA